MNARQATLFFSVLLLVIAGALFWLRAPESQLPSSKPSASFPPDLKTSTPNKRGTPSNDSEGVPWLEELESQKPLAFSWTEVLDNEPIEHFGGILFLKRDGRVYSRAWFGRAKYVTPWPPVEGIGSTTEEGLQVAYRSASGDPEHDFYFAECHFKLSADASTMEVEFEQQAQPPDSQADPSTELSPGRASARRVRILDANFKREHDALLAFVKRARKAAQTRNQSSRACAVLPHIQAKADLISKYKGKEFYFCCEACLGVFNKRPDAFAR